MVMVPAMVVTAMMASMVPSAMMARIGDPS